MQTILGQKIEQTQRFLENGNRIPVSVVSISPNTVLQVRTQDKNGYSAVQIGTGMRKKATKSQFGSAKQANLKSAPKFIKEVRFFDEQILPQIGEALNLADVLKPGDMIDVTGISKGKGWAGVVKRHNFRGGPRSHGQSDRERAPGSLGQTTTPGRVYKGKRMAGRMGQDTVTVQNLYVADVIGDKVYVAGLIPGHVKTFVILKKTGELKDKYFSPMLRADGLDAKEMTNDQLPMTNEKEEQKEIVEEPQEKLPEVEVVAEKVEEVKEEIKEGAKEE
ncbi:MAG TPA: 50S ribosomal protein L3 [Patescibacteria group bacterium]|nr:50S ribosomal protein L3 [Patescibacteria group bacterium]